MGGLPSRQKPGYTRSLPSNTPEKLNTTENIFTERQNAPESVFTVRQNTTERIFTVQSNTTESAFSERSNKPESSITERLITPKNAFTERPNTPEVLTVRVNTPESALTERPNSLESSFTERPTTPESIVRPKTTKSALTERLNSLDSTFTERSNTPECAFTVRPNTTESTYTDHEPPTTPESPFTEQQHRSDSTFTERSSSSDSTLTERPSSSDSTLTERPSSSDSTLTERPSSSDSTLTERPSSSDSTLTERPSSSDSTLTKRPSSSDCTLTERPSSSDSTLTERPSSSDSTVTERLSSPESTFIERLNALSTDSTFTERPSLPDSTITEQPDASLSESTFTKRPFASLQSFSSDSAFSERPTTPDSSISDSDSFEETHSSFSSGRKSIYADRTSNSRKNHENRFGRNAKLHVFLPHQQCSNFEGTPPSSEVIIKMIRQGVQESNGSKIENALSFVSDEDMPQICEVFCTKKPEKCLASRVIMKELKSKILKSIENKNDILYIWAGRQDERIRGIDTVILVTQSSKQCNLGDKFWGLNILVRCANTCSNEASSLLIYDTNDSVTSLSFQPTDPDISSLFTKHSNISLINISNVRSIGYNTNARIEMNPSIVIHCHIKGVIPIGEDAFPKKIKGHRVDVREAVCSFAGNEAKVSERIVNEDTKTTGTLGGFVTLQNPERQCFLTCAHVVLPFDVLKDGETSEYVRRREVNVLDKNGIQFGKVHKAKFKHGQESQVSIDAALVEITDQYRYPCDGNFAKVFTTEQIMKTGFSKNNLPRFDNGEIEQVSEHNFRTSVLKIGAKSGLTIGSLKIGRSCARIHDYDVQVGNRFSTTLFKQMEVIPHCDLSQPSDSREPFLDYGDSGSFVYFISHQRPVILKCIGLAVAKTSHGTCLVTPIDKVFEALDLPFNCLSKFTDEATKRDVISVMLSKLNSISNQMATKDDIQKIEGDISSIKDRLSSTESNVKRLLERNIEETNSV